MERREGEKTIGRRLGSKLTPRKNQLITEKKTRGKASRKEGTSRRIQIQERNGRPPSKNARKYGEKQKRAFHEHSPTRKDQKTRGRTL